MPALVSPVNTSMTEQRIDKERHQASIDRLYDIFKGISMSADAVQQWRCPYKDVKSRCTAKFKCRNQFFTNVPGELAVCTGSDKIDYRDAWQV